MQHDGLSIPLDFVVGAALSVGMPTIFFSKWWHEMLMVQCWSTMCWHSLHCRSEREIGHRLRKSGDVELAMQLAGLMVSVCCMLSILSWPTKRFLCCHCLPPLRDNAKKNCILCRRGIPWKRHSAVCLSDVGSQVYICCSANWKVLECAFWLVPMSATTNFCTFLFTLCILLPCLSTHPAS